MSFLQLGINHRFSLARLLHRHGDGDGYCHAELSVHVLADTTRNENGCLQSSEASPCGRRSFAVAQDDSCVAQDDNYQERCVKAPGWLLAGIAIALALATVSCSGVSTTSNSLDTGPGNQPPAAQAAPTSVPTPAPTATPTIDLQRVKPNELGTIPILEFHQIADAEEDQWSITPDHFRQSLQQLYDAGFRPVALNDVLDNRIDIPAGTSPVVLTFDDSSPGQFRFLQQDGQVVVDPNSAVGMLEAFHAAHPDFAARATFNVLPEAAEPNKLFGQPEYETQKLQYLVQHGFEIGNHTYWHQRLDEVDGQEAQRQLALAVKEIDQAVPGYKVRAFALPLGIWPQDRALAFSGSYDGVSYQNDAVLLVGSDPAPSPNRKDYDPQALPRVQVFDHNLDRWLDYLAKNADERYVSDGDPNTITFPQQLEAQLNPASAGNRTLRAY